MIQREREAERQIRWQREREIDRKTEKEGKTVERNYLDFRM